MTSICDICGKQSQAMSDHMKIHDARLFDCEECGKKVNIFFDKVILLIIMHYFTGFWTKGIPKPQEKP